MAPQSDQTIQNATFPNVRSDINDNLEALFTQSSGSSEPTTKVAFQPWVDTSSSPPVWKIRNAANSAWITVGVLDPAGFTVGGVTPIANGGTGQTTVADAIAALLPSQTGNDGKALTTNGTALLWSVISSSSFTKYTFAAGSGTGSTRTHTWTKPDTGTTAIVLIWGGGGGGSRDNSRGGGGAGSNCQFGFLKLSELGSTETITLGQGGAAATGLNVGSNGTNSTFGSHVTAYGARGGNLTGVSGSQHYSQGTTPFGMGDVSLSKYAAWGDMILSGGYGARAATASETGGGAVFGGAGGGSAESFNQSNGGTSIFGGDGGVGADFGTAGDGQAPGGGGGGGTNTSNAGSGGPGECWVMVF